MGLWNVLVRCYGVSAALWRRVQLLMVFSCSQAFSVFFVCVAFTSDIICLLFIPVQWLFFAASTYVWVQYVWHTGWSQGFLHLLSHCLSSNEPADVFSVKQPSFSYNTPFLTISLFSPAERGVCLPTVSLWILFVYIEAAIRFKDLKNFHVDLCRPFAAHW